MPAGSWSHAIRVVAAGDALLAPAITRRLLGPVRRRLPDPAATGRARCSRLTEREREVLVLVARGLSNAEIAGRWCVSETTVKTHVGRVLAKLGLRDRVQAVVLAYESGLVAPPGVVGTTRDRTGAHAGPGGTWLVVRRPGAAWR